MSELSNTTTDLAKQDTITASAGAAEETVAQNAEEENSPANLSAQQPGEEQDSLSFSNIQLAPDVSFASEDLDNFKALAAELKLSEQQAQKLVDFESACAKRKAEEAAAQKHRQSIAWANETKALYGAGLEQEITYALRAANTFGGPELRALLEETGLGNHPVMIRTLSGIGRTISEDICPGGTPSAPQDKTFAEALYGKRN